jgi:hypothetical protein
MRHSGYVLAVVATTMNGCACVGGSQPGSTPSPVVEDESTQARPSPPTHMATGHATHAATDKSADEIVIGTLQHRNEALIISASGRGPRFSVRNAKGHLTACGLSEAELSHKHGGLHRIYRSGIARQPGSPFLDARLDPTVGRLGGVRAGTRGAASP